MSSLQDVIFNWYLRPLQERRTTISGDNHLWIVDARIGRPQGWYRKIKYDEILDNSIPCLCRGVRIQHLVNVEL